MKKKFINALSAVIFLPLSFVYFEALLRAFGGGDFTGYACPAVFGVSAGLITAALLCLLPPRANKACTTAILAASGLVFATETLINKNFHSYMTPASVFAGAKGVLSEYGDNLAAAVTGGVFAIILFLAPTVLYALLKNKLPISPREQTKPLCPIISAVCSAALFFGGTAISGEEYGTETDFSRSAESFGLLTALRLNIQSSLQTENTEGGFLPEDSPFVREAETENTDSREAVAAISDNIKPTVPVTLGRSDISGISDISDILSEPSLSDIPSIPDTPDGTGIPNTPNISSHDNITLGATGNTDAAVTLGSSGQNALPRNSEAADGRSEETHSPKPKPIRPADPEAYGKNVMELDFDGAYARNPSSVVSELNGYVQSLAPSCKNEYTGLFAGKNLILICAEAFSDCAVDEQLTPTLYRLAHNGIYFSEYYQPTWGGSTTTGEFSFVMGLVPESGIESMRKTANNNNYLTLGSQLRRQGYNSCAFHNGNYDYYSRNLTHKNMGYDDFLAFGSGLENVTRKYSEDSAMIDKTIDLYLDKQPFSLYYMTVSGHFSYKAENGKVKENLPRVTEVFGNKYKDKTNYYLCYQMELDKALRILVEKLEAAGIADDTVICITADHYPYGLEMNQTYGNSEDYISDLYGYKHSAPWEKDRNAWILWSGCLENEYSEYACEVSEPTYSLDIVPTLSNLFGLEYDSRLLVGRDVFSDAPVLVVWNNLSWITDKGRYNSKTKEYTPTNGEAYSSEYVKNINNMVKNKIYFSKQTVNSDYYGALFGKKQDN